MKARASKPHGVFICYRRQDAAFPAGWLYEGLTSHFGDTQVFKDVDSLRPGDDFLKIIVDTVTSCDAVLVVIGPAWLSAPDVQSGRRIDGPNDVVRIEIETALQHGVPTIPVLVLGATMPRAADLPPSVAALAGRNAVEITPDHFNSDLEHLIATLEQIRREALERAKNLADEQRSRSRQNLSSRSARLVRTVAIIGTVVALVAGGAILYAERTGTATGGGTPQIEQECQTGMSANQLLDCEIVAVDNSLDGYWSDAFARSGQSFTKPRITLFTGSTGSGCGPAMSVTGPFYCPADSKIYLDPSFFHELEAQFRAQGGPGARGYVIAHVYGHHIQHLLGTDQRIQADDTGPASGSVRLELQADCYAGVWINHAPSVPTASGQPLLDSLTQAELAAILDTVSRLGDKDVQSALSGSGTNQSHFAHGSSAQRVKWYSTGYQTGDPARCDTFARDVNLG